MVFIPCPCLNRRQASLILTLYTRRVSLTCVMCRALFVCSVIYTFITPLLKKFSTVRAQIFAHMSGSHGISQFVPNRWVRDGGAHRAVLQPRAATSVSHNSLPKPSVWVPGREFCDGNYGISLYGSGVSSRWMPQSGGVRTRLAGHA